MEQITLQPTELRIGNWVNWKDNGIIRIVTISQNDGANSGSSWNTWTKFEDLEGIPLTPDILEKCGFVIRSSILTVYDGRTLSNYRLKGIWVYVYSDGEIKVTSGSGVREHIWIKYLHQLQNLYFALCGKELAITI